MRKIIVAALFSARVYQWEFRASVQSKTVLLQVAMILVRPSSVLTSP